MKNRKPAPHLTQIRVDHTTRSLKKKFKLDSKGIAKNKRGDFNKYGMYERAVQSPETDVLFFRKTFRQIRKRDAKSLREDFCGTFQVACEWTKLGRDKVSYGVDIDPEPLDYGFQQHFSELNLAQQGRCHIYQSNVLNARVPKVDMTVALNFSYYLFKERNQLLEYFKSVHARLKKDGVFILDCFGGSLCQNENVERTRVRNFSYVWDQSSFNPITHEALFKIHFKRPREATRRDVFVYDWRMWSIPELRDILTDAGFKKSIVYWEGTARNGGGDGVFKDSEVGDACYSWIAYIVGLP